jgi:hypothetical protein
MAIVALYRVVELETTRVLRPYYPGKSKLKSLHKIDKVRERLKTDFGIELDLLPGYEHIRELLLLNNCIKHSGRVSPSLAEYPGWTEGQEVGHVGQTFERLSREVAPYLVGLHESIIRSRGI